MHETSARHFGDGGPATLALAGARAVTQTPDGAVVFFDQNAYELRRIDPVTHVVTAVAGTGARGDYRSCRTLDTTADVTSVPLTDIRGLWSDGSGALYLFTGGLPTRTAAGNIYRLDPNDHRWHLVVTNPLSSSATGAAYLFGAVDAAGDVFVVDALHNVIRRFAPSDSATGSGTVIAGVADSVGPPDGDGGPATAARIEIAPIAAADDGTIFLAGHVVRRIDATTGIITTVAGTGVAPPSGQPNVDDGLPATQARVAASNLAVSHDGSRIYTYEESSGIAVNRTFTVGGSIHTVVGPASVTSTGDYSLKASIAIAEDSTASPPRLLVALDDVRSWPIDGSSATSSGAIVAGLRTIVDSLQASPDGVPLSDAFVPSVLAVAVAPDRSYALITPYGIRTLPSLDSNAQLGTLSSVGGSVGAYDGDGTLYIGRSVQGDNRVVAADRTGATHTVFGGGSATPQDGAVGTSVALGTLNDIAVDQGKHILYAVVGNATVWAVDLATDTVSLVAGGGDGTRGPADGAPAAGTTLLGVQNVAVDQRSHALYLLISQGQSYLDRVDFDGTLHLLGGSRNAGSGHLEIGGNGVIYAGGLAPLVTFGPDGATATPAPGLGSVVTALRPDNSVVAAAQSGAGGGLLQFTDPIAVPAYPEATPTATASANSTQITITITPPATTGQTVYLTGLGPAPGGPLLYPDGNGSGDYEPPRRVRTLMTLGPAPRGGLDVDGSGLLRTLLG